MTQTIPVSMHGRILFNQEVVQGHFHLQLTLPTAFPQPLPGQFVMIREKESTAPLLARPMSIYAFERGEKNVSLEIFYRVVGDGTRSLSSLKAGREVLLLGPLGQGFSQKKDVRHVILIAGGIGISPLTFLAASLKSLQKTASFEMTAYIGAQHQDILAGLDKLSLCCPDIRICTDDGSRGYSGRVTDLFERELDRYNAEDSLVYACGPYGMMKRLAELLERHPLPCQVSVEEKMACGLGACLGCAVPVRTEAGETTFRRVCKDGPVFDICRIRW
jgi:dihydroorotate dehydrogenase electron transfer subunit